MDSFSIVFVCTGNRFRSPLAEAFVRRLTLGLSVDSESFGVLDLEESPALPEAIALAGWWGLDVSQHGGDEAVTLRLWREAGLRVVPGRYLARDQADGSNPGAGYIRVALVQDQATTAEALHRLVGVLG